MALVITVSADPPSGPPTSALAIEILLIYRANFKLRTEDSYLHQLESRWDLLSLGFASVSPAVRAAERLSRGQDLLALV